MITSPIQPPKPPAFPESTERLRLELRDGEEGNLCLFENMRDAFAYCQLIVEQGRPRDFIYLAVNRAFETLTGLKSMAGKRASEVIPGVWESDPNLLEVYGRVAFTGVPEKFESYVAALKMWLFISVHCPKPNHFVALIDVITERKQAEARLKGSEAQYRRLFESAKDGILILNAETGMIEDANPFLTGLLGLTREQVLQKNVWELGCFQNLIANHEKFVELQQAGYVRYEDLPLETTDGRKVDVEFVSNVYEVNGAKVIQCNIRDISERKLAEAALKQRAAELERFHRLSIGRELQMIGLKQEVNELAKLAGRAPAYDLSWLEHKSQENQG